MDFCVNVALHKILKHAKSSDNDNNSIKNNTVISPFGICVILNMIADGAEGSTLDQLLHFLKLQSAQDVVSQASELMKLAKPSSSDDDDNPVICNINAVLVKNSISLKKDHKEFLENFYQAKVRYVDVSRKDEAVHEVNEWIKQETNGLIKQLLLNGAFDSEAFVLSHANGLYFNGKWENEFSESDTRLNYFYLLDRNKVEVEVPFMYKCESHYDYGSFDDYTALKLPYETSNPNSSRRFSMIIVLPEAKKGLPNIIENFKENPHLLSSKYLRLEEEEITCLSIPRFKLSYSFLPSDDIIELGLELPFADDTAELNGILEGCNDAISVSRIIQHTDIVCNEKGTEVVSCTYDSWEEMGFSIDDEPPPKPIINFIVDRPFMFIIKEDETDTIFFLGAIFDPFNEEEHKLYRESLGIYKRESESETEDEDEDEDEDEEIGFSLFND